MAVIYEDKHGWFIRHNGVVLRPSKCSTIALIEDSIPDEEYSKFDPQIKVRVHSKYKGMIREVYQKGNMELWYVHGHYRSKVFYPVQSEECWDPPREKR